MDKFIAVCLISAGVAYFVSTQNQTDSNDSTESSANLSNSRYYEPEAQDIDEPVYEGNADRYSPPRHDWYCVCYDERVPKGYGQWEQSTACRKNQSHCERLRVRIMRSEKDPSYRRLANPDIRTGPNFSSCTYRGTASHPSEVISSPRHFWERSNKDTGYWTKTGCL